MAPAREALLAGGAEKFGRRVGGNFEQRRPVCRQPARQVEMAGVARKVGAGANFAGSGGAVVGVHRVGAMFRELRAAPGAAACRVLRPGVS
ncbi:MAG TPA: hypothetical protein VFA26_15675 [Gemmataceae bacterium]|nr:hypothetical protein [Gemmataceae bacterium]